MATQTDVPVNAFEEIFVEGWREMKALCKTAEVKAGKVFPHDLRPCSTMKIDPGNLPKKIFL